MLFGKKDKNKRTITSWNYKAKLKSGKKTKGSIDADTKEKAEIQLRQKGYSDIKVKKQPKDLLPKKISYQDITEMTRQLAIMTKAGIPIIKSFEVFIMGICKHPRLKILAIEIKQAIEGGESFSKALRNFPKIFDKLYVGLITAGEESGNLDLMLNKIADQREALQSIKKKVKKALSYPIIVCIIAAGVTGILLTFAVPAFSAMFINSGKPLPAITQLTVDASNFMQNSWWKIILAIFITITVYKSLKFRFPKIQIAQDHFILKVPIIGEVVFKSSLARFASTLEITVQSGMSLTRALDMVSLATGNAKYDQAALDIKKSINEGASFKEAIVETGNFPFLVEQMIAVGEESGALETMLGNLNRVYQEEVDTLVGSLSSMLEPLIMIVLGGVVGFLVVSMYMPMFQMGDAI
ncbi:type II secretion system F family protein [Francisella tularensis]|uniref:type II secretion system F family protein n=1 Tax=Francisella tularensis TaxID=263 RepID=UPI0000F591A6|nr:type II secretion system F family protein [Francisella tularensis]ABO46973.1 type II secretion system protein F/Type IV pili polytopic inner membrane protein [Francisella tularensis subsp. tularensis WY96-3418]AJI63645.1 type II secretion system (T2SS), F family protein [Francisella tularensis subsp. tularensis]AKH92233.1 type II secretion system protein F [Francisella tularensis subsp. tularensis WY-00W4114]AKU74545.1 type II secretion system (T2SS), F family protein [Francisella tularensis